MKQTQRKNLSRYSKKLPRYNILTPAQRERFCANEPKRKKFLDTSDVEKLNDISKPSAQRTIRRIKATLCADTSTRLTLSAFCTYYGINPIDVEAALRDWKINRQKYNGF